MSKYSHSREKLISRVNTILRTNDVDGLRQLLSEITTCDLKMNGRRRMISDAARLESSEMFDLLVAAGADVNMPPVGVQNPLYCNASAGKLFAVKRLLAAGADVEPVRNRGSRKQTHLMHEIAATANPELLELLVIGGGWKILDQPGTNGKTPIEVAQSKWGNCSVSSAAQIRDTYGRSIRMMEYYAALPRVDFDHGFTKAELFTRVGGTNGAPLEHPETWKRWDEVVDQLRLDGKTISKRELLTGNANGKSWVQRAAECFSLSPVVRSLNRQGEWIGASDLTDANGYPNDLMRSLADHRQLGVIFKSDNCKHWSHSDFTSIMSLMTPEDCRSFVPNLHQLRINAQHFHQQQNQGRIGKTA